MREVITTLLEHARIVQQIETLHPDLQSPVVGVNYEYTLSADQKNRLHRLHENISKLTTRLSTSNEIKDVHPGTTSSICAVISCDGNASLVIELSLYVPLAAIFTYGDVPYSAVQYVIQCIHELHLTALQPDEIQELEHKGVWHMLF